MAEFVDNFSDLEELGIDYDSNELDQKFNLAADHLPKLLSILNDETLLTLYAFYKQGKEGTCNTSKPSWYDFKAKSKWEAWKKLENMSQEKAKTLYINTIKKFDPDFDSNVQKGKEGNSWVSVSTLQNKTDYTKNIVDYIKENNREKVTELLKDKINNIDELDENGLTLMHWASDIGSIEIISDLLEFGANINVKDSEGQTPLHYSSSCGHVECVQFLLSKGASIDAEDSEGLTPFEVASDEKIKSLLHSK